MTCVALVDDDASLLRALGRLVTAFGYEVRSFNDAAAFLACEQLGTIACVLTDIHMPGPSGLDLLDAMRRQRPAIPVIVMTTYPLDHRMEEIEARGAAATLAKPIRAGLLESVLAAALGQGGR